MDNPKIIAVIPAYNEAATIADVVLGVKRFAPDVVVVNDCSTDDTAARAHAAGAHVVNHVTNTGYDGSLDDGFKEAARLGADIIVTCDGDGQHRVEDVRRACEPIVRGDADVVVGQRPALSRVGESIFAIYTGMRFGIHDPLCGLKAYHRKVYDAVGHFDTVRSIGTQLMVEAWLKGFRIKTIPVTILPRADESRFYSKLFRANLKILSAAGRVVLLSMKGRQTVI